MNFPPKTNMSHMSLRSVHICICPHWEPTNSKWLIYVDGVSLLNRYYLKKQQSVKCNQRQGTGCKIFPNPQSMDPFSNQNISNVLKRRDELMCAQLTPKKVSRVAAGAATGPGNLPTVRPAKVNGSILPSEEIHSFRTRRDLFFRAWSPSSPGKSKLEIQQPELPKREEDVNFKYRQKKT